VKPSQHTLGRTTWYMLMVYSACIWTSKQFTQIFPIEWQYNSLQVSILQQKTHDKFFRRQKERERERGSMNWFEKDSRVSLLKASVMIDSSRQLLLSTINLNFLLAFQILNPCDCKKNLMNLLQCCCSTHSHTCRYPCQYLPKTRV
jgi:hypothetical protein